MANAASIVPLTIESGLDLSYGSSIVIGNNTLTQPSGSGVYWAVVLDRTTLKVLQNFTFKDNQDVPSQLTQYIGNAQYIMILTTVNLPSSNLPTGKFYTFLRSEGAGSALDRLEQIYQALSCGTWGWMSYTLVSVLDQSASYEFGLEQGWALVSALSLLPIQVGPTVLYTPTSLE